MPVHKNLSPEQQVPDQHPATVFITRMQDFAEQMPQYVEDIARITLAAQEIGEATNRNAYLRVCRAEEEYPRELKLFLGLNRVNALIEDSTRFTDSVKRSLAWFDIERELGVPIEVWSALNKELDNEWELHKQRKIAEAKPRLSAVVTTPDPPVSDEEKVDFANQKEAEFWAGYILGRCLNDLERTLRTPVASRLARLAMGKSLRTDKFASDEQKAATFGRDLGYLEGQLKMLRELVPSVRLRGDVYQAFPQLDPQDYQKQVQVHEILDKLGKDLDPTVTTHFKTVAADFLKQARAERKRRQQNPNQTRPPQPTVRQKIEKELAVLAAEHGRKSALRKLARKYHPDTDPNDTSLEEKSIIVNGLLEDFNKAQGKRLAQQ